MHVQSCCFAYITLLFSDVLVVVHVVVKVRNVTNARAPSLGHRLSLFSELSYWFTIIWTQFFKMRLKYLFYKTAELKQK